MSRERKCRMSRRDPHGFNSHPLPLQVTTPSQTSAVSLFSPSDLDLYLNHLLSSVSVFLMDKIITYKHSRLAFVRDIIEPLNDKDSFRIESNVGIFQMTKAQFRTFFPNVRASRSYIDAGCYHYPTIPQKARQFLVEGCHLLSAAKIVEPVWPSFLSHINKKQYFRWLNRKALAHVKRDKKRGNKLASAGEYKDAIHAAVVKSGGVDAYTGHPLDWTLLSKYNNEESKSGRRTYKKQFAHLPTVDHIDDGMGAPAFCICSWRTNDSKHDLTMEEFLDVCKAVVAHHSKEAL